METERFADSRLLEDLLLLATDGSSKTKLGAMSICKVVLSTSLNPDTDATPLTGVVDCDVAREHATDPLLRGAALGFVGPV